MKIMGSIISSHNKQISQANDYNFGCILTTEWAAAITSNFNHDQNRPLEVSETPFKERFRNHTRNFKHQKYEKCTELSKYI